MSFTFLFIIGLILVSGFIAYFGDLLGRRMGKKRLALFRLRPRYTAIVVTTITGMLISALALTALISVDSQFRKVFTQGELILKQNETLSKSNTSLESQIRILERQRQSLAEDVKKRKKEVAAARSEAEQATRARDIALKTVTSLERDIEARQKELIQLKKKGAFTEAQLKDKIVELHAVQEKMSIAQRELADARNNLTTASEKLTTSQAHLQETEALLIQKEAQLVQKDNLLKEKDRQIAEKQELLNTYYTAVSSFASGKLVFRQGDEIVRGVVSSAQLNDGIQMGLINLVEKASVKASTLGAGRGLNGRYVNIVIFMDPKTRRVTLNEADCMRNAVGWISKSFGDVLVQVVCAANTTEGFQAPVELRLYDNKLIFREGQKIAGTVIDGSSKDVNILYLLTVFLQQDVARTALDSGIVPIPNADSHTTQGINSWQQFEALMAVLERIKQENAPVYVDVCAAKDIYSKDQLTMSNMNFVISTSKPLD